MSEMAGVETTPSHIFVTYLVGKMEFTCEYGETGCDGAKAEWALIPRLCCSAAQVHFACTGCKDYKLTTEDGVQCPECGFWTVPARHHYTRTERI